MYYFFNSSAFFLQLFNSSLSTSVHGRMWDDQYLPDFTELSHLCSYKCPCRSQIFNVDVTKKAENEA